MRISVRALGFTAVALMSSAVVLGQTAGIVQETIQVTATRVAEDVQKVPAEITVVTGDELRARNATDLATALGFTAGVAIAPGGDSGPASSVPEMWGLREFDAFLLVVDDIPWGGAFNPDLATLDLNDIDRIEIVRGSAPVMYGATSFVGVIHVIHRKAGSPGTSFRLSAGNFSSGSAAISLPLTQGMNFNQSLNASIEKRGFRDDRTGVERGHLLYRGESLLSSGRLHFDADLTAVMQDPASPHPRQGRVLSAAVPLDANHNPDDAKFDETRIHLVTGWEGNVAGMPWTTSLALTHSKYDIVRGFLADISATPDNARGYEQDRSVTDVYFDTHLVRRMGALQIVAGIDHLFGMAKAESGLFDYTVSLDGETAQSSEGRIDEEIEVEDMRNFTGVYLSSEWTPTAKLRIDVGARLNHASEEREGEEDTPTGPIPGKDNRDVTRGSGIVGLSYEIWSADTSSMTVFTDYRNTFKPAAIDFGPEAEAEILRPETAKSYEVGVKGRMFDSRWSWQAAAFQMDFENLVVGAIRNGLPVLVNSGRDRFRGFELESDFEITRDLDWKAGYSNHDSRFVDSVQLFDGVPTQLAGKKLEMTPRHLFGTGFVYSPASGFNANVLYNFTGERYLNKRNTALADSYSTVAAGAGYRFGTYELRVDGRNLTDERPPVAESELGDAQYYRLPARTWELTFRRNF